VEYEERQICFWNLIEEGAIWEYELENDIEIVCKGLDFESVTWIKMVLMAISL
jgi:hypothetical protein